MTLKSINNDRSLLRLAALDFFRRLDLGALHAAQICNKAVYSSEQGDVAVFLGLPALLISPFQICELVFQRCYALAVRRLLLHSIPFSYHLACYTFARAPSLAWYTLRMRPVYGSLALYPGNLAPSVFNDIRVNVRA